MPLSRIWLLSPWLLGWWLLCGCHLLLELEAPATRDVSAPDGPTADAPLSPDARAAEAAPPDLSLCAWPYRRQLTFDNSIQTQDLQGFPVPVRLSAPGFDFNRTQAGGRDLRFVDADGLTSLPHEIERWSSAQGSVIWVRVPQIDGGSTTDHIWLYYGNPGAAEAEDAAAVWSDGYLAVWHLSQPPGAAGSVKDSTGQHPLSPQGSLTPQALVQGRIGGGLQLDGFGYLTATLAQAPLLYTYEAWFKLESHDPYWEHHLVELKNTQFMVDENLKLEAGTGNEFDAAEKQCKTAVQVGDWHHAVFVQSKDGWRLFLDHKLEAQGADSTSPQEAAFVGAIYNTATSYGESARLHGVIDEVRISSVPRSAGWITAQHLAMEGSFVTVGAEEPTAGRPCPF